MRNFDIDVVIPVWSGDFRYSLDAINKTLQAERVSVLVHIVCDNLDDEQIEYISKVIFFPETSVVIYRSREQLGPSVAVNSIARHYMQTRYLAIQDADDIPTFDRFYKQYRILQSSPEIVHSSGSMRQFAESGYKDNRHIKEPIIKCLEKTYSNMPRGKFINSTRMIKRHTFHELNGFPNMMVSGDLVLDNNLIYLNYVSYCFEEIIGYRRVHHGSITHQEHYLRNNPGGIAAINEQLQYLHMIQSNPTIETARSIGKLHEAPKLEIVKCPVNI